MNLHSNTWQTVQNYDQIYSILEEKKEKKTEKNPH